MVFFGSQLHAQDNKLEVRWIGGPSMQIIFNGMNILTDPMLGQGKEAFLMADPNEMFDLKVGPNVRYHQRITKLPKVNLAAIDLVLLSHAHEDHFDQQAHKQLPKDMMLLLPKDDEAKIGKLGFTDLDALTPGDTREYKTIKGNITITAIPADHTENHDLAPLLGHGLGFYMVFKQGDWQRSIYWTGDSMPTNRVINAVRALGPLDILIPNMGRVGTTGPLGQISMGASDVIKLAQALNVSKVLPIHHSTYSLYLEPINSLAELAQGKPFGLDIISEGSSVLYR